ncbi:hypothetical protein ACFWNN_40880 [Lentzea sp. NPDC058450]|uniref:hypothetical protein n=1 Tax=Lentzea sp. NPDC058450 TaxID=3346505 RepID=UPI003652F2E2
MPGGLRVGYVVFAALPGAVAFSGGMTGLMWRAGRAGVYFGPRGVLIRHALRLTVEVVTTPLKQTVNPHFDWMVYFVIEVVLSEAELAAAGDLLNAEASSPGWATWLGSRPRCRPRATR